MSIEAPVVPVIFLITAPPGPITAPIFSGLMWIVVTRGAVGAVSVSRRGNLFLDHVKNLKACILRLLKSAGENLVGDSFQASYRAAEQ